MYSLFGSKEGLLVDALAQSAYAFLADGMDGLPETDDPVADLVAVGVPVFRTLVLEHPAAYRIAFQRITPGFRAGSEVVEARERALAGLLRRVERLANAGLLGDKSGFEAAVEFNAMLEGLANAELRGTVFRTLPAGEEEQAWREALLTVIRGFELPEATRRRLLLTDWERCRARVCGSVAQPAPSQLLKVWTKRSRRLVNQ